MRKLKYIPLLLIIFTLNCEEGNEVIYEPNAKLIWTGEKDVDGCGFFVEIDSIQYKPENEAILPPQYRTAEPLDVTVQYIDLLYEIEYFCGDLPDAKRARAINLTSLDLNQELP